jgi:membrane-bound lytic murein transglycosylase B
VADVLASTAGLAPGPSSGASTPQVTGPHLPWPHARAENEPASISRRTTPAALVDATDIPAPALVAYQRAAIVIDAADHSCNLDWALLAAIGRIESDHGRFGGSSLDSAGIDQPPVYGPVLDGRHGTALVRDTDDGRLDHNTTYDRAVGPMQFLPSTWAAWGIDAFGQTGPPDIMNPYDAVPSAARMLCADGAASGPSGLTAAIFDYNHAAWYVNEVLALAAEYARDFP